MPPRPFPSCLCAFVVKRSLQSLSNGFPMSHIARCLVIVSLMLCSPVALPGKPTLTIAFDDGPHSRMLKSELTRDWTQPNPALKLTRSQKHNLQTRGTQLNALAA